MIALSSQKRYILGTGREVVARADMILYSTSTYHARENARKEIRAKKKSIEFLARSLKG